MVAGGQKTAKNAAGNPTVAWLWTREAASGGGRCQGGLVGAGTGSEIRKTAGGSGALGLLEGFSRLKKRCGGRGFKTRSHDFLLKMNYYILLPMLC